MKNKNRILATLLTIMLCFTTFSTAVFAGGGEEEITTIPEVNEPVKSNPTALTPDGNLTLVDDVSGEQAEDKQFVTVISKNGNYFYLVIDRAGDRQNVYFLNLVDEEDLLTLIEEDKPKQQEVPQICNCINLCEEGKIDPNCSLCRNDLTKCTGKPLTPTSPPEPEKEKNKGMGGILLLLIVGMAGGGIYYFKVLKDKQNTKGNTLLDDYDFDDEEDDEYEYETEIDDEDESEVDI
ncbi:DUF4366 domain-containing protein [Jeotgalibaca arthritidis]|uniref:DUF4366 domain-containing protein n=1 Tax=Jeotgalibaca arthritidis TaxID=1868794 RepID=A0A6G7K7K4_9LACT|nr:DUF4366 domain-containing protein [Jeotgalibaca arthritidis]QII81222.1 DUF4366 domain-containing protein [Jeotgalibaca arthritidis]